MSIILKGIDLPKTKDNRWIIQIYSNGEIHIAEEVWDDTKKGHDKLHTRYIGKSEAIQVPKDHGRLIDAKVCADTICQAIQSGDLIQKSIWEWIADAPTILEAEE